MQIRFLGVHNSESRNSNLVSFIINDTLAIDAGSLSSALSFTEQKGINTILLSHGHLDHINGLGTFAFNRSRTLRKEKIQVVATPETLHIVRTHLFDGEIYPEFTQDKSYLGRPVLNFQPLEYFIPTNVQDFKVMAIPVKHSVGAAGFSITSNGQTIFYSGDTGPGLAEVWDHILPQLIIIETTYPDRFEKVAKEAGHLCPKTLKAELMIFRQVKGYIPKIILIHTEPEYDQEIYAESNKVASELGISLDLAREGQIITI